MTTLVNVLIDDPRFNWNDISIELQKTISFYQNFGVDLVFLPRLRELFLGINLHFCQPNGSYAYPSQRRAMITLSDWFYRPNERWGVIDHELVCHFQFTRSLRRCIMPSAGIRTLYNELS